MIRNLKVLGLVVGAVFAITAMYASTASAQGTKGWLTSDGPVTLEGTDTVGEKSKLTFIHEGITKGTVECHGEYEIGTVEDPPHDEFMNLHEQTITSITVDPHYTECVAKLGAVTAPATVTMNGCDYVLTLGNTIGGGPTYGVTADAVCPPGSGPIEVHVYQNAEHKTSICTYTFGAQAGKTGGIAQNDGETVTLGGTFTNITATRHKSVLCGAHVETTEAKLDIHALLQGTNEDEEETKIYISETA